LPTDIILHETANHEVFSVIRGADSSQERDGGGLGSNRLDLVRT